MCARSILGSKVNPNLKLKSLNLNDIKKIFPVEFASRIKGITFNGNYGDPAAGKDVSEILHWFREQNPRVIFRFHSNGGLNSPEWWASIAPYFKEGHSEVHFSIDGLEHSNHLYRLNVHWDNIMKNASAFIEAGGQAAWDFIAFRHNEHQIDKARNLSKSMGFKRFVFKKTGRFTSKLVGDQMVNGNPVYDKTMKFQYFLEAAKNESNVNTNVSDDFRVSDLKEAEQGLKDSNHKLELDLSPNEHKFRTLTPEQKKQREEFSKTCSINCRVKKDKSIYIDHLGNVFPCCWTAWPYYGFWDQIESREIRELIDSNGGIEKINALKNSIQDIVHGDVFNYIATGISKKNSNTPLYSCATTCGDDGIRMSEESPNN